MSSALHIEWRINRPDIATDELFLDDRLLTAAAQAHGRTLQWLVCEDEQGLAAAMPVTHRKKYGLRVATNPPQTPYLPLWTRPGQKDHIRLTVCRAFAEALCRRFHKITVSPGPVLADVRGFTWDGLRASPFYTYIIDLTQPQCRHKSKKEALRKARRLAPTLREELDIDLFLNIQRAMFAHQGKTPPLPPAVMTPWLRRLHSDGLLRQFVIEADGKPASSHAWLFNPAQHYVFAWLGANDPAFLNDGVPTWAFDAIFKQLQEEGFETLDLCGANIPRLNRYYETFGGRLALYYRLTKPLPGLLGMLSGGGA